MSFTHLHVHSHYSLLDAIGSPKALLAQAKALGMSSLALTDYFGMYGAIEFYKEAQKHGINPLIGTEIGYVQDMNYKDPNENAGTIVLLARDYIGYQNLMQLVSKGHLEGFHKLPRIDLRCLQQFSSGVIALGGGPRSRLGKLLLAKEDQRKVQEQLLWLVHLLGKENCFLSRIVQDKPGGDIQQVNQELFHLAKESDLGLTCSGDVHYVYADDLQNFEIALAIKDGKRVYDTDRRHPDGKRHLQSEEEIRKRLKKGGLEPEMIEQMIDVNNALAESIHLQIPMGKALFPVYESPAEVKELYEQWKERLVIN